MRSHLPRFALLAVAALSCIPYAQAQSSVVPNAPAYLFAQQAFTQQDLDAMLAPIALYPDSLLAQILMAATYPQEIADAARWSASIAGATPQQALQSVAQRGWDPSVQSLMAFPQVLQMMGSYPDWTQRLGNAFLSQQTQVWATVQGLRQRAYAAGYLRSNEQLRVLQNANLLLLEPANPEVIYVPYYDPLLVYGRWWWPGSAPMRWNPWPGYAAPAGRGGFYRGSGVSVGLNFFFGQVNWNTFHATVQSHPEWSNRRSQPGPDWRHEPEHRHDVPYTNPPARLQPTPGVRPEQRPERQPEKRPEAKPEYPGQIPSARAQPEPAPSASRKPADNPEHRNPGLGRAEQGHAAPAATTPVPPARSVVQPTPRPDEARAPGNEGRGQNAAPAGHAQPAATPRASAETRAPAKEPERRSEEPVERNLSGK